jgi:hypothetical protein
MSVIRCFGGTVRRHGISGGARGRNSVIRRIRGGSNGGASIVRRVSVVSVVVVVVPGVVHAFRHDDVESRGLRAVVGVGPVVGLVGRKCAERESNACFRHVHSFHCHVAGRQHDDFAEKVRRVILNCNLVAVRLIVAIK